MKTKAFDCVEMKRKGAQKVYEATRDMSAEEEAAYWQERTEAARRWLAEDARAGWAEAAAACHAAGDDQLDDWDAAVSDQWGQDA